MRILSLALLATHAAAPARAQLTSQQVNPPAQAGKPSCFDAIPDRAMTRVPVHISAEFLNARPRLPGDNAADASLGTVPATLTTSADLFAETVANQVRAILNAGGDSVPWGEPRVTWQGLTPLRVTVYRNEPMRVHDPDAVRRERNPADSSLADAKSTAGARLLAEAVARSRAAGEPVFLWPDVPALDSVTFLLDFSHPGVTREGKQVSSTLPAGYRFLVFSLRVPWESQAYARKQATPDYPRTPDGRWFRSNFTLHFYVDTTGRADPSTIMLSHPPDAPPLSKEIERDLKPFVDAARRAIRETRYEPATFAGCKVKVLVAQPFAFDVR